MMLIVAGLFKKVVISNLLATRLVEPVFAAPQSFSGADIALAIYGYAAQIYCDFSGYTSIAIGCALLLGYRFPRNFNAPIPPPPRRTSGAAGTSRSPAGCGTISTSRSVDRAAGQCEPAST